MTLEGIVTLVRLLQEEKAEEPVIDIEPKEEITFDDFMKMQFQVGEIIA